MEQVRLLSPELHQPVQHGFRSTNLKTCPQSATGINQSDEVLRVFFHRVFEQLERLV